MPIDISDKEQLDVPLTGTQMNDAIVAAHNSKSAIENIDNLESKENVAKRFGVEQSTSRVRLDASITLTGGYYPYPDGDMLIYQVNEGEEYEIIGESLGSDKKLYGFYPTDSYANNIELGETMTNSAVSYVRSIVVPVGANYLYLSKADGYEIGLYRNVDINNKEDKSNTILLNEKSIELTNKAANGTRYVDTGLNTITFSDGKELYLWQIIKSIKITCPENDFDIYTSSKILRTLRINTIAKYTDAYISFAMMGANSEERSFSGLDYHLPFGIDEKNIEGTFSFLIDGSELTVDVVYDFSEIGSNTISTDAGSVFFDNNILSDTVVKNILPKAKPLLSSEAADYATINAFNLLEKAPSMIKFGSTEVKRTRHASCVFGDMHEDWTPLYNINKIYDLCPDFKDYVFATIGVGDFLISTRTREDNLVILEGLKTAISSHNIPFGACIGGHDFGNDTTAGVDRNRVTHCLTKQDQRDNIIIPSFNTFESASLGTGKTDACYWYADDTDRSVRYIFLDECDLPDTLDTDTDFYKYDRYADLVYSQEQLTWLTETALNVSSGWNIVLCTHTAISYKDGTHDIGGTVGAMWDCVTAYNDKTTASISLVGEIPIAINKDFSLSNGKIICMLWGHTHAAANYIKDGINIVNIPNSGFYGSNAGYSLKNAQDRDCAEFLIADTVDNDLRFLRYGRRGVDVISGGIPLEIKPNDTGDRFVDTPLTF